MFKADILPHQTEPIVASVSKKLPASLRHNGNLQGTLCCSNGIV